jgi:hypothetical protein
LGRIHWRKLKSNPPPATLKGLIEKGQTAVQSAQKYREGSRTAAALGAIFSAYEAKLEADAQKRRAHIDAAIDQADRAVKLKARSSLTQDAASLLTELVGKVTDKNEKRKLETAAKALLAL